MVSAHVDLYEIVLKPSLALFSSSRQGKATCSKNFRIVAKLRSKLVEWQRSMLQPLKTLTRPAKIVGASKCQKPKARCVERSQKIKLDHGSMEERARLGDKEEASEAPWRSNTELQEAARHNAA